MSYCPIIIPQGYIYMLNRSVNNTNKRSVKRKNINETTVQIRKYGDPTPAQKQKIEVPICDNYDDFLQVELTNMNIHGWQPLPTKIENPKNCIPTALALTNIISKHTAQQLTQTGLYDYEMENIINENSTSNIYGKKVVDNYNTIFENLKPGHATMVWMDRPNSKDRIDHITVFVKDKTRNNYILEGQSQQFITGTKNINNYINSGPYIRFYVFCPVEKKNKERLITMILTDILGKRKKRKETSLCIRKPKTPDGPPAKRPRIDGGKSKKRRGKSNKCTGKRAKITRRGTAKITTTKRNI